MECIASVDTEDLEFNDEEHFLSFDPGTTGGRVCVLTPDAVDFYSVPLLDNGRVDLPSFVYELSLVLINPQCVAEYIWVMPKQGASSSAKFVEAAAAYKAACWTAHRNCEEVNPRTWKKHFDLESPPKGLTSSQRMKFNKDQSTEYVRTNYPWVLPALPVISPKTGRPSKTKLDHNSVDAFLLAIWLKDYRATL